MSDLLLYIIDLVFSLSPLGKAAIDRMTSDMATELKLRKKNISVISIWPGLVRTEKTLSRVKQLEEKSHVDFTNFCKPYTNVIRQSLFLYIQCLSFLILF